MKCPDCGAEIATTYVEVFHHKLHRVDHETKTITPIEGEFWEYNDYAFHCPECDSLNIDDTLKQYDFKSRLIVMN